MHKLPLEERAKTASNLVIRTAVYLDIWSLYHGSMRACDASDFHSAALPGLQRPFVSGALHPALV